LFESGYCKRKRPRGVKDNKMKLNEIGSGVVDMTNLTQNRET